MSDIIDNIQRTLGLQRQSILKAFGVEDGLEKAKSGIYKNTFENRKLGRIGQKYGIKEENEEELKKKIDQSSFTGNIIERGEGAKGNRYVLADVDRNKLLGEYLKLKFKKHGWVFRGEIEAHTGSVYVNAEKQLKHQSIFKKFRISNHGSDKYDPNQIDIIHYTDIDNFFEKEYKEQEAIYKWEGSEKEDLEKYLKMKNITFGDIKRGELIRTSNRGLPIYQYYATIYKVMK